MSSLDSIFQLFGNLETITDQLTAIGVVVTIIGIIVALVQLISPLLKRIIRTPEPIISNSQIYIERLPTTDNNHFVGREELINQLNQAWSNPNINIFALHAMGGMGKTALINKWLQPHKTNNWVDVPKAYAWSFHNQGDMEGHKQSSSSEFINHALVHFDNDKTDLDSDYKKGQHLAKLISKQPCLLILDGLEPFQYFSDDDTPNRIGKLRDNGLKGLLETLAKQNAGLCVVTTRIPINNALSSYSSIQYHELETLSEKECIKFLKQKGVTGKEEDFIELVNYHKRHIFSLHLVANYLVDFCKGDIRQHDTLKALEDTHSQDAGENQGDQAYGIMQAYEKKLKDTPALALLYVVSIFDKPIEKEVIDELIFIAIFKDKIGMNKFLLQLDNKDKWQQALTTLTHAKLLSFDAKQQLLDTHPLVRQYFKRNLQWHHPADWKRINAELYAYYKDLPKKQQPDTLEEMQPLFAAIAHGCAAGMHQAALVKVYYPRIMRDGKTNYLCNKLGAFGSDLSALSHFFSQHWSTPVAELTDNDKAAVLNWAAFRLRALGRLQEAVQPMQADLEMSIAQEDWKGAAASANNLSELQLTRGAVSLAITAAQQSVELADKSGDAFYRMAFRTTLANAQHQAGELVESHRHFKQAEALQKERQPEYPQLNSQGGFRYCDLLLTAGKWREVQQRADQALELVTNAGQDILSAALDQLSLGRATLVGWISNNITQQTKGDPATADARFPQSSNPAYDEVNQQALDIPLDSLVLPKLEESLTVDDANLSNLQTAKKWLNQAVEGLREAGAEEFVARGLLARASYHRYCLSFGSDALASSVDSTVSAVDSGEAKVSLPTVAESIKFALADLQEIHDIAQRGGMLLHLTDYHLESARLTLTIKQSVFDKTANEHIQKAKQLIDDTGYKRRLPEVEYLEQLLTVGRRG